jgi:hypothetical protein
MDGAALMEIMEGIGTLDVDPIAKREFGNLVRGIGAAHGCVQIVRTERIMFARELLARKVSRPTVRDRLIASFGVSRPQAYLIIKSALRLPLSKNGDLVYTPIRSNGYIE